MFTQPPAALLPHAPDSGWHALPEVTLTSINAADTSRYGGIRYSFHLVLPMGKCVKQGGSHLQEVRWTPS
jgi:hypothetical protein